MKKRLFSSFATIAMGFFIVSVFAAPYRACGHGAPIKYQNYITIP